MIKLPDSMVSKRSPDVSFVTLPNFFKRSAHRLLVGKPEGKRTVGRPKRRWVDDIEMDLIEIGWGWGWTGLVWLRIGTSGELCELGNEPSGSIKCLETSEWLHNFWPLK
jgi:hypothetical protein